MFKFSLSESLSPFNSKPTKEDINGITRNTKQINELLIPLSTNGIANELKIRNGVQRGSEFKVFMPTLKKTKGVRKNTKEIKGISNKGNILEAISSL